MSLFRKSNQFQSSPYDFAAMMDQKNGMIASLQSQVESLRAKRERYEQVKQQLYKWKCNYQALLKDHQTRLSNNQQVLNSSVKSVGELRMRTQHLAHELNQKMKVLKETKIDSADLVNYYKNKEDQSCELNYKLQEQTNLQGLKKMQGERTSLQISQVKEEVGKSKKDREIIQNQIENIHQKSNKTQAYIRNLQRQQSNLKQILNKTQNQNMILNSNICELDTLISINNSQVRKKQKFYQELQFHLNSKLLLKKKIQNETRQKLKQQTSQKQNLKSLATNCKQAQLEQARIGTLINETSAQINCIFSKNSQISEVNEQLQQDLIVCQRHLDNVLKTNSTMQQQIKELQHTNLETIYKLKHPKGTKKAGSNEEKQAKWDEFDTGDFQRQYRK